MSYKYSRTRAEDIIGNKFHDLIIYKVIGSKSNHKIVKCMCLKCMSFTNVLANNILTGNTKHCNKCKQRKFNIKASLDIYRDNVVNKLNISELAKKYKCSRNPIYTSLKAAKEYLDLIETDEFKDFMKWAKEHNLLKDEK